MLFCLLVLLIFFISLIKAQKISISEPMPFKGGDNFDILGQVNGYSYLSSISNSNLQLYRMDKDLSNLRIKDLKLPERRAELLFTCIYKQMIYTLYSYRQKAELCYKLWIFDSNLDLQDSITLSCIDKQAYNPSIKIIASEDKSSLLIYYQYLDVYIQFFAVDLNTKSVIWKYNWDFNLEHKDSQDLLKILYDNNRRVSLIFNDVKQHIKNTQQYNIFCLSRTGVINNNIMMHNIEIYNADWFIDNNNSTLLLLGSYFTDNRNKAKGVLFGSVSIGTQDSLYFKTNEFKTEWLVPVIAEKEKVDKNLNDFHLNDLILKRAGGVVIILENQKEIERTIPGRNINIDGIGRNIVDYYYNDILVISLDKFGNIEFTTPLFKKQFSQDDDADYSSYLLNKSSDYLRLIYNDEIENENTISQYLVDAYGKTIRQSILNTDYRKLKMMFKFGKQVGTNTCLIPSYYRNKIKMVKMEF